MNIYIYVYIYMYLYMYIYVYVYIYICICMVAGTILKSHTQTLLVMPMIPPTLQALRLRCAADGLLHLLKRRGLLSSDAAGEVFVRKVFMELLKNIVGFQCKIKHVGDLILSASHV